MVILAQSQTPVIVGTVAIVASLGAVWWSFFLLRRRQLIADTPTSKCAGVFMGWNEVGGQAITETPSESHFAKLACVSWEATVEQEVRVTTTHTSTDASGRRRTTKTTSYDWRTVERWADASALFRVVDDSGSVFVDPEQATVHMRRVVDRILGQRRWFAGDGPTGRYRERESVIEMGEPVYVVGTAQLREGVASPVIDTPGDGPFIVTVGGEASIRRGYAVGGPLLAVLALVLGGVAGAALLGRADPHLRVPTASAGAGAVLGVVGAAALVLRYNGMVRVRNRADRAYSLIDVMLQRRHDLVPRLVACVNGAAAHERQVQVSLASYRSTTSADAGAGAREASEQSSALRQVFALAEASPTMQSDVNFTHLQASLADTEDRIAAAREFYNESATTLRDRTHTFPGVLLAKFGEFADRPLFAADGFERTVPSVHLDVPPPPPPVPPTPPAPPEPPAPVGAAG